MKDSNFRTPRTMAEGHWTPGYRSIVLQRPEPLWEKIAGYVLATVIGVGIAAALFLGLSA